jgi:triosephosphate isomerase
MKKLIIANWKMNLNFKNSLSLAKKMSRADSNYQNKVIICPDYISLLPVGKILKKSNISLGAQDSAITDFGAYTGEVSPVNLKDSGVKYVILGHSERREHLHENSAIINAKIISALNQGLVPILCIGEKLIEREEGKTKNYLSDELRRALKNVKIKKVSDLIIAYEPVWAISTNKAARSMSMGEADIIQQFIKKRVAKILKKNVKILYGGSINASNARDFLKQKNIDGLLIGGATLNFKSFDSICSI